MRRNFLLRTGHCPLLLDPSDEVVAGVKEAADAVLETALLLSRESRRDRAHASRQGKDGNDWDPDRARSRWWEGSLVPTEAGEGVYLGLNSGVRLFCFEELLEFLLLIAGGC